MLVSSLHSTSVLVTGFRNESLYEDNLLISNTSFISASDVLIPKPELFQKLKRGLNIVKREEVERGIDITAIEKEVKAENSGLKIALHVILKTSSSKNLRSTITGQRDPKTQKSKGMSYYIFDNY